MNKLISLFLSLLVSGMAIAEQPKDYSDVDSQEKVEALAAKGELHKILLFPAEFGGKDAPGNVVYVPKGIPEIKAKLDGSLVRFYQEGSINQLNVGPKYKGKSFVPSSIEVKAWHSEREGGFNAPIEIW